MLVILLNLFINMQRCAPIYGPRALKERRFRPSAGQISKEDRSCTSTEV